ncbi:MAG: chromosomal replication initiator protein DnaA [Parcubacteria group bacterium Licking1014_17]|nr:MAG: chromosomal replication initiator protein DnaA [Parcubacteria group bacterium Licking1014_17]
MNSEELWKAVLSEMELSLSRASFTTWFKETLLVANNNGIAVVGVPNGFIKEWLENKYNKQILNIIRKHDQSIREVKYSIGNARLAVAPQRIEMSQILRDRIQEECPSDSEIDKITNLNHRYTFESFVVGVNNELAHAACVAVTKNLGKIYNPLFIYGGVGLGKTHILQATGNLIHSNDPTKRILYIPAEKLTTQIVESIKNRTVEELKQRYGGLDLLIIDDIQFIAGKERTQDIFFGTFNELYSKNKQIILSSDRPPSTIPALEERLRSRFEGGMIADIQLPDYETRLAILKLKGKEKGVVLDEESLSYIATNIQKNIRELEGVLNRIAAFNQIYNKMPTIKEIKQLLTAYLSTPYRKPTPQLVMKSVADFYKIHLTDLTKRSRRKEVVHPRQIAMYLLREEVKFSFPEIGLKLGGRDHSTVIHACTKIREGEENSETIKQELTLIKERIYQSLDTN